MAYGPFRRLVDHFLDKMARGGQDTSSTDMELSTGGLLGLLAAPGAFASIFMLDKYSSLLDYLRGTARTDVFVTSLSDKYLFLALAMAVTGIVTVLRWDQLLPDSQDYLNLAPLPMRPRRILLANAVALMVAVVVVALAVNAIPAVLFPMFVSAYAGASLGGSLQFVATHTYCVILASLFSIGAVFAVLGTLSAVLPREAFRAVSSWVRGALLLTFIALLLSGFAGASLVRQLQRAPDSLVQYLPSVWFVALYQDLQHRATPALAAVVRRAYEGTAAVSVLMLVSYTLGYRRRFASVLEGGRRPSQQRLMGAVLRFLDLFAVRTSGFQRACHRFVVRALLRSESHRLAIAVSVGLGWLLSMENIDAAPLTVAYLVILGLRVAFELPASVPANWVFRVTLDPRENETRGVAQSVVGAFLTPLVLAPCLGYSWWQSGAAVAVVHTLYVAALCLCAMELQFAGYRKLPLTCPMPGFSNNFLMLCLVQFLGFEFFTHGGAAMEHWMFEQPWRFVLLPAGMAGAWWWNRRRLAEAREAGELEEGLTFESAGPRIMERMDLS